VRHQDTAGRAGVTHPADLEPLAPARIESIVDELFLPLVRSHGGAA
jgi:hypothetical protein